MEETFDTLRTKILGGAIELFIEKGIEKVTTRELTEHVGISRSHIYHYFRDWQTLCIEALTIFMLADLEEFTTKISPLPPAEKLHAFVSNYLPTEPDAVWQLYGSLWQLAAHNTAYAELARKMTYKWEKALTDIVSSGVSDSAFTVKEPERVARQLAALLNGYSDQLIVSSSEDAHQQALEDIRAFIGLVQS